MSRWHVTSVFTVEVDAEDAVTAEAKTKTITPTTSQIQGVGKLIRTHWGIDAVSEETPADAE